MSKHHQRLGGEDDCNLGVDEPRRGEVVPLVAGVEPPFAVDDFFLASSLLTLASSCARWGGDFVGRLGLAPRAVWLVGKGF